MTTYHLIVRHAPRHVLWHGAEVDVGEQVGRWLEGALIEPSQPLDAVHSVLPIQLAGHGREDALNAILAAVENAGFALAKVVVEDAVDRAVEGLAVGFLGGLGLGEAAGNPVVQLLLAVLGSAAGGAVGSQLKQTRVFEAWHTPGGWQIVAVPQEPAASTAPQQPGLAWG